MLRYLIDLLKGLFLEFRGASVHDVALGIEEPLLMGYEPTWDVHLVEHSTKARVLDLEERGSPPIVREGCFQVKIETGTLSVPAVAASLKGSLPLLDPPEVIHQTMAVELPLRETPELVARVFSNISSPPLWKKRVKREAKVEREKIERALRVLQEAVRKGELKNVAFSGYFKSVPNGTFRIAGNDLIVEFSKTNQEFQDLVVFRVITKDNKTRHVFIFLS